MDKLIAENQNLNHQLSKSREQDLNFNTEFKLQNSSLYDLKQ